MKIAVVGASGRTGAEVVRAAQDRGHHVTAVVRQPARLAALRPDAVAVADGRDVDALTAAFADVEAVVSCVGPVKGEDERVQSAITEAVLGAAADAGVHRCLVVTASGWVVDGDDPLGRYLAKPILARVLREENAAFAETERLVHATALDWTIVRPPMLRDGAPRGSYRQRRDGNVRWRYSIRRSDLAVALCDLLADPTAVRTVVSVAA
ncbi:NAD(P)-dependent oxidoreductase [Ruania alba]|uniref:Putative NADH-flavin reductase n=1 Tax=Ruania alba TaxID=648782 RepID=A0A1H5N890_9MICO|nr:NAD(P)H-binding protein [Ruania alba]SEE97773.1 Putative NADH-flavin reductase [Ruania alba]